MVTYTGIGTCVINADQPGSTQWLLAPGSKSA